ncbi:MAG TPA: hypothetical protein VEQ42_04820 [Pyrinomonadaceae bacterium]|nr:hypothetical protein [Pyrinomonadaceae bacterium]
MTTYTIECECEPDGRWLAEVLEIPGVLVYGQTPEEVLVKAQAQALRAIANRLEHCGRDSDLLTINFVRAEAGG